MYIDYDTGFTIYKIVQFKGQTSDGKNFTANGTWSELEDWTLSAENITWDDKPGTEEQIQEIIYNFVQDMNS